jgi:hypothetical protein
MKIEITLSDVQIEMLDTWIAAQPADLDRSEAVLHLMVAGLLLVHSDHTNTGEVGALWTGKDH